jgi:preprotein translocase subunit YajC
MNTFSVFPLLALADAPGGLGALGGFLPMVLIFVIFYVVLILPMRKRQKALQQVIANLKRGDRVITTGGLYGEVAAVDTATVVLKIADTVKVKVARSAIAGLEEADKSDKGDKG